ncbi:MAG TPA: AI-2E family transporter [Chloroflexota bacterium]|nr:AI-2E family transporter [Chloroflexota bacterium]
MQRDPWLKTLIILLVLIAASYLAGLVWTLAVRFADILLLLVLAWVLAFVLEPVAYALETRYRLNRAVAVGIVYLGLLVVLSLFTILLIPVIALQVTQIGINLPIYVAAAGDWLTSLQYQAAARGLDVNATRILDYNQIARYVESMGPPIVNNALALATGVASLLFDLILVLMFSFYVALDGSRFATAVLKAIPIDRRDDVNYLIYSTHQAFGGFIRGQLIQALIYGLVTVGVMMAADLSYTAAASVFGMAIMLVPVIGPMLALIPPVVIALLIHPGRAWWVFIILLLMQQVILNVLGPRFVSRSVGMHPLLVLVSLLVGSKLAGMWGALFAVPVAGVIVAMVSFYRMTVEERKVHMEEKVDEGSWQATPSDEQPEMEEPHPALSNDNR